MLVDGLVHQRLGDHRLVGFVVALAAKTDEVDEHVLVVFLAVFDRNFHRQQARLGVVAVDVKDRRFDHLGHIGAIQRAARVARIGRGEADLVVDDDVDRAAGSVAARLGKVERLLHHALTGNRGVAVNEHRHDLVACRIAAPVLPRAHRAFDDGIAYFQVRRIERERQVHRSARRDDVGREALVVLHVAGGKVGRLLALEFGEQIGGHLAQRIDQDVEPPAMRHADHHLLHTRGAGLLDQVVEHRNHGVAALARKPFLPDIFGAEVALERLGGRKTLEDVPAKLGAVGRPRAQRFDPFLDEALLRRIRHVHVFGTERAAVRLLQRGDQVPEAHPVRTGVAAFKRTDVELGIHVGLAEPIGLDVEVGDIGPFLALQRVEIRVEHAQRAELADQPQHQDLLVHRLCVDHAARKLAALRELNEGFDDRRVRDVVRIAAQRVEIAAPVATDRAGVRQVGLVLLLDKRRVAAEEGAVLLVFPHHGHGVTS